MSSDELSQTDLLRYKLLGSFLDFTRYFYKTRTGRKFELSEPVSRESHYITVAKALKKTFNGEHARLIINIPPRYGKTEMLIHWIAWCIAHNPASQFIYVSYSKTLATKQTATIRQIITHPEFKRLFPNVQLAGDAQAKDNFETTAGGSVYAVGSEGSITGRGAGIKGSKEFGGAIVIDDIIKPADAVSDVVRKKVNDWYFNTLLSRRNDGDKTPIVFIGQRLHEDDLGGNLLNEFDGHAWEKVIIPALNEYNHALMPSLHDSDYLLNLEKSSPYEFAAQYQQNPQPAGGGIFNAEWFSSLPRFPSFLGTFITADTAETDKTWNDATVFSFWGVYKISYEDIETEMYAIMWLDCHECRVEPKDLKNEFMSFWSTCMQFTVKPKHIYIEKKSTGTTLVSILNELQGLSVMPIERTRNSGSKTSRFLECQPYAASKQITFLDGASHRDMCIKHMSGITSNDSHKHDDIADTFSDAVKIALIDNALPFLNKNAVATNNASFANAYRNKRRNVIGG